MSLIILTKPIQNYNLFSFKRLLDTAKRCVRFFLKKNRGPQAVTKSLLAGLRELNIGFKLNPKMNEINHNDILYVNESAEALRNAISLKKRGKVDKIIAGPVISILPEFEGGIVLDSNIDLFLVPSNWTKDFWISRASQLTEKIAIWAAGVDSIVKHNKIKGSVLVYYKSGPIDLLDFVINLLKSKNIKHNIIYYGQYDKDKYYEALDNSTSMIYLSESESQGLALCEAWMHNVPTLVWNRGFWEYCGHQWFDDKISAPYLADECGMFFSGKDDFRDKWNEFSLKINSYKSRDYALKNFTNRISAKKFIDLIKICFPNISFV